MTGRVSMLNISRWMSEGGSYPTIQRFFNTVMPSGTLFWVFFRTYLFEFESVYILAGDESVVSKSGESTYGLSRVFSSVYGKTVPGLPFFAVSLVSVKARRSYPMVMEQIVRGDTAMTQSGLPSQPCETLETPPANRKRGRPKGNCRNQNKTEVEFSDALKHLQTMLTALLARIGV